MAGIFKAYDIRGIYGEELTADVAYKIGRAFVTFAGCKKVVVARDIRPHSEPLFEALTKGICEQGADVIDIGHGSTPMSYYANGSLGADGSVMITASHNPAPWNGFKLCKAKAEPISGATGILDIEKMVLNDSYAKKAEVPGTVSEYDILPEYTKHVAAFAKLARPVHIAIDFANGMGLWENKTLDGIITFDGLYDEPDGLFPNHEANPLNAETLVDLQKMMREGNYAFGVAYDGDADRAGFVDEKGDIIPMDLTTALVAQDVLAVEKGVVFYDLRSSWVVKETIEAAGGTPMMSRVGHAFIKKQMRENNALFAGELSGHYYFKENFTAESSAMAILALANIVSKSDKPLSELVAPLKKYFQSGEINSEVDCDPQTILAKLKEMFSDGDGRIFELDGVSVEFDDWWFNVRCSNTEPLVRLNLEAKTNEMMQEKRDEILAVIRG
ncbi:MAG: phosphomannomutase/phosphoglucomutase [Kiritimatiellae bacterium]|jgi:phosphomannomutase|nr:phosphomannomutase/phosphoglucomutase [Kiritimatiellia bacterium]